MDNYSNLQISGPISATNHSENPKKKSMLILLVVLVIVISGTVIFFIGISRLRLHVTNGNKNINAKTSTSSNSSDQTQYDTLMSQAFSARNKQEFFTTASSLTTYANQTHDANHRYNALSQVAALYASAGQYQNALNTFKETEQIKGITFSECNGAGSMAKLLGEEQTAIFYFQKCISLTPTNYPTRLATIEWFNQQIAQLKK